MKGDKGECGTTNEVASGEMLTCAKSSPGPCLDLMTTSVSIPSVYQVCQCDKSLIAAIDMVLEDVTEL